MCHTFQPALLNPYSPVCVHTSCNPNNRLLYSMKQLLLDIAPPSHATLANFVPGRNSELLQTLSNILSGKEKERFVYLWGGTGCGNSHLLQAVAGPGVDRPHRAGLLGAQDVLHLHRLDDGERLSGLDMVTRADVKAGEQPRHRADQEARQIRRHLLQHVARELGDMGRVDRQDVARASASE